jgi:2-oxoglutarate dehydrogenase E2 component (dihydrolipoamide succinyltransferase)
MAAEIKVPEMGESVIEGTVARWLKQEGDAVSAGEPLVEIETDKVNVEVGAQQDGVLQQILKQSGETVSVGDVLGMVGAAGGSSQKEAGPRAAQESQPAAETQAEPEAQPAAAVPAKKGQPVPVTAATPPVPVAPAEPEVQTSPSPAGAVVTPVAQRMANELGIDLAQVKPSAGGRITREDVEAFIKQAQNKAQAAQGEPAQRSTQPSAPASPRQEKTAPPVPARTPPLPQLAGNGRREERVRMTRRRQTIARRLVEAQHTAAMLTTFNEIDMSAVMDLRKRRREGFKERYGVDLGYMSFFTKAVIGALKAFPRVNAEIASSDTGDEIVLKHYYDIGIAIGAEEGLVVPVIRDADRLSFAEIEKAIREFSAKTREGTLTIEDLRGGTFTITNGGVFGSLLSTPILNPPQVGILGMHKIQERPVVVNGQIVARPMMYVALSYDHRIVDGREAVQFLVRVKELVEDPEALLFG